MFRVKSFKKYAEKYATMFDIFDNTTAQIVERTDYDDLTNTFNRVVKGSITGDLQPYSSEFAQKEYGKEIDCQCIFYCRGVKLSEVLELDSGMEIGMKPEAGVYFVIDGKEYEVRYVTERRMRTAVLLKEELY